MRRLLICGLLALIIGITIGGVACADEKWPGVDDAVVGKFATEAGRPPREPYINTGQGDLQLFCFLMAGIVGGVIIGYQYRALFSPKAKSPSDSSHV